MINLYIYNKRNASQDKSCKSSSRCNLKSNFNKDVKVQDTPSRENRKTLSLASQIEDTNNTKITQRLVRSKTSKTDARDRRFKNMHMHMNIYV